MSDASLSQAQFAGALHTRFRVVSSSAAFVELELIELRAGPATAGHEAFALTFLGPGDVFLGQGMVALSHATMGTVDLFIVPVAKTAGGFLYEVIFNR